MSNNQINENTTNDNNIITNDKETKRYNLKNDVIFKAFFAKKGNEKFLIDFLTGLLKKEIKEITIEEEANILKFANIEKGGRIDLQATLGDGTIVSIEMQVRNEGNIEKRSEFNASGVLRRKTEKGTDYKNIKQVIMVNILDYSFLEVEDYVSETTTVLNKHREYELPSLVKHYYIELPKYRKQSPDMDDKLNQWLAVIDDKDGGRIKMAEEKNEKIKSALDELGYLTGDAEVQRIAELKDRWERDWNSSMDYATEKGREEGKKENQLEIAKKMLKKGISIETIIEITNLTKQEIENLQKI